MSDQLDQIEIDGLDGKLDLYVTYPEVYKRIAKAPTLVNLINTHVSDAR